MLHFISTCSQHRSTWMTMAPTRSDYYSLYASRNWYNEHTSAESIRSWWRCAANLNQIALIKLTRQISAEIAWGMRLFDRRPRYTSTDSSSLAYAVSEISIARGSIETRRHSSTWQSYSRRRFLSCETGIIDWSILAFQLPLRLSHKQFDFCESWV